MISISSSHLVPRTSGRKNRGSGASQDSTRTRSQVAVVGVAWCMQVVSSEVTSRGSRREVEDLLE
jgi:hypothetical protein